jgi:hypothetical protein
MTIVDRLFGSPWTVALPGLSPPTTGPRTKSGVSNEEGKT